MPSDWDWRRLEDSLKSAQEYVGRQVRVTGGGLWLDGTLLSLSPKREASVQVRKGVVQSLSPVEQIEDLA